MPYYRIVVRDGKLENTIVEQFATIEIAREAMTSRGWRDILGITQVSDADAKAAFDAHPREDDSPIPVAPGAIGRDGEWHILPDQIAAKHPLHGVAGWLMLLAVLLILSAIGWAVVALSLVDVLHGGIAILFGVALVTLLLQIWPLTLPFGRSRIFPTAFVIVAGPNIALSVLDLILSPSGGPRPLISIGMNLAWIVYVLQSARVDITYRRRVREGDPFLKRLVETPAERKPD